MQIYVNEKNHHMDIVLNSNCILSQFMFFYFVVSRFFFTLEFNINMVRQYFHII
jgi:hypothetical protein